ncbi:MAG TPA: glycosyltransferase [Bacteroidia bacterium]|nr:glycosyltransferase [Bacteroidia bacterium]
MIIINLLLIIVFATMAFTVIYSFFYAIAGHFYKKREYTNHDQYRRIAVLMPAYKEDEVILQTAKQALFQQYPSNLYSVYVIADSLKKETIATLKKLPLTVVEVSFDVSTKSKSLNEAFAQITKPYDIAVILDADNIMRHDFLEKVNAAFISGCYAVQGHRKAKNKNTNYAVLDAISEEANNHMMRKGQVAIGLSSSVIGSGMAFSYLYLKQVMKEIEAVGGFDKELELRLIRDNHKIVYLEDAIVLDEKVQKSEVFANQRTRWISAQLVYLRKYWLDGVLGLISGKIDYANKVMHYALVPKVLLIGSLFLITIITAFTPDIFVIGFAHWFTITTMYYLAFIISIPKEFWNKQTFNALISLPQTFFVMMKAMFKIKGANKRFIHTPHTATFENNTI